MEQFQALIVTYGVPLLVILSGAIGALLIAILVKVLAKLGIELSDTQKSQLRQFVQGLILQLEEHKRRKAKEGVRVTSAEQDAMFKALAAATPELVKLPLTEVLALRDEELPKVRAALTPQAAP